MLRRLWIENFLLIKDLELEFEEGLNVISGETGTGKSMTLSAVEFVMGKQGDYPEGTAVELEIEKDRSAVILRREIKGGRSRYYLDGRGTSSKVVREILENTISLQGQNEFLKILKPDFQREALDRFGGHSEALLKVSRLFDEYSHIKRELNHLTSLREETVQKRDYWEFKVREIEEVGLSPSEVEELKEKAQTLKNLEKLKKLFVEVLYSLYDDESSAYANLGNAIKLLWKAKELGSPVDAEIDLLTEMKDKLYEAVEAVRDKDLELSPEEIDRINETLFKVQRLEKKYGKSYAELVEEMEELKKKLAEALTFEDTIEQLKENLKKKEEELLKECAVRSDLRKESARKLEMKIGEILSELNMKEAKLKVLLKRGDITQHGFDEVRFLFSSYGKDLKPLEEVASGGELTRLFLALSLINPPVGTYIFDEIDVGVSGETSVKLAKLLKKVSKNMQVIVITHSAPICAAGDVNFLTTKEFLGDIPYIRVKKLSEEEKLTEVARLMGTATENTIRGAKELVDLVRS